MQLFFSLVMHMAKLPWQKRNGTCPRKEKQTWQKCSNTTVAGFKMFTVLWWMKAREREKEWGSTLPSTANHIEEGLAQPRLNVTSTALLIVLQPEGILEPWRVEYCEFQKFLISTVCLWPDTPLSWMERRCHLLLSSPVVKPWPDLPRPVELPG